MITHHQCIIWGLVHQRNECYGSIFIYYHCSILLEFPIWVLTNSFIINFTFIDQLRAMVHRDIPAFVHCFQSSSTLHLDMRGHYLYCFHRKVFQLAPCVVSYTLARDIFNIFINKQCLRKINTCHMSQKKKDFRRESLGRHSAVWLLYGAIGPLLLVEVI